MLLKYNGYGLYKRMLLVFEFYLICSINIALGLFEYLLYVHLNIKKIINYIGYVIPIRYWLQFNIFQTKITERPWAVYKDILFQRLKGFENRVETFLTYIYSYLQSHIFICQFDRLNTFFLITSKLFKGTIPYVPINVMPLKDRTECTHNKTIWDF